MAHPRTRDCLMIAVAAQGIESLVAASPCPSAIRHFKSRCIALRPTIRRHSCRSVQSAPVVLLVVAVLVELGMDLDGMISPFDHEEGLGRLAPRGDKCTDNAVVVAVRFWGGEP